MAGNPLWPQAGFLTLLLASGGLFAGSPGDARQTPGEPAIRQIMPAVVAITGYMRTAGTESEYRKYGESSGFFVEKGGFLLTVYSPYVELENRKLCEKFEVELSGGEIANARMFSIDPALDLAILKMAETAEYPALDISFFPETTPGEQVWALAGKRGAEALPVFSGRVKADEKTSMYGDGLGDLLINTYMELPAHARGGPLVNRQGKVLGMNIPYTHQGANREEAAGEAHTVPLREIATIYRVLMANPTFEQNWPGFSIRLINLPEMALIRQVLQQRGGVVVDFVWGEGPAAQTGLRNGDILVGLNGSPILTPTHFKGTLFEIARDTSVELTIIRDGALLTVPGRVEKRPLWAAP